MVTNVSTKTRARLSMAACIMLILIALPLACPPGHVMAQSSTLTVVVDTVDTSGTHIDGEVLAGSAWAPAPVTLFDVEPGCHLRARYKGSTITTLTTYILEDTTLWVDPLDPDGYYYEHTPGVTEVKFVFRPIRFETVNPEGEHVEGEIGVAGAWLPAPVTHFNVQYGLHMRAAHEGAIITSLTTYILEDTTLWVDPLDPNGYYYEDTPGVTEVKFVFRPIRFDTVDSEGEHVEGEVGATGAWVPTAVTLFNVQYGLHMRAAYEGCTITSLTTYIQQDTTFWVDLYGNTRRVSSPAITAVIFVFGELPSEIPVDIDIKPGSDPKSVNLKSNGVLPVAILTSDDFDALGVDDESVKLGDPRLTGTAAPLRSAEEDVDGDGDTDLLLFFSVPELVDAGALDDLSEAAMLTGETVDGVPVVGVDSVGIVPGSSKGKDRK